MTDPKLCECGCGHPAPLAKRTDPRRGLIAGQPARFIRGHAGSVRAQELRAARTGSEPRARFSTPSERYAEDLLHHTELLVGAVHDDGPDQLRAHLAAALRLQPPPAVDPLEALVTVLCAQIDPDTTAEQRLGWVRAYDQEAAPRAAPTPRPDGTPRRAAAPPTPREENAA